MQLVMLLCRALPCDRWIAEMVRALPKETGELDGTEGSQRAASRLRSREARTCSPAFSCDGRSVRRDAGGGAGPRPVLLSPPALRAMVEQQRGLAMPQVRRSLE